MRLKIKKSKEDKIFDIITYIMVGILIVIILYPLYFIVIASISDPYLVANGRVVLVPKGLTMDGYKRIFQNQDIWIGYRNTLLYTVVGTAINVFLTTALAYPLSRKYFSGRKAILFFFMFTMYFSGGMIPTFLLVKGLKLEDTFSVMVILGAVSVFNVIITKTFMENNVPQELEEAAMIDGCDQMRFFFKIAMPISGAIIAVLVLYYGIAHWNDYMRGLIYLQDTKRFPLQLVIRSILISTQVEANDPSEYATFDDMMKVAELVKYGVIIVASLPVMILYPFLQKYFDKGALIGSVKG